MLKIATAAVFVLFFFLFFFWFVTTLVMLDSECMLAFLHPVVF